MNFRRRCTGFGTKKVYLKFYGQISQWKIPMQYQSNQHEIPLSRERSFLNEENALFSLPILRKGRNKVGVLLFLRQTLTCVAPLRQGRGCVPPAQPTSRIFRKRYLFRWQKNEGKQELVGPRGDSAKNIGKLKEIGIGAFMRYKMVKMRWKM